jgi:hypothetical protein
LYLPLVYLQSMVCDILYNVRLKTMNTNPLQKHKWNTNPLHKHKWNTNPLQKHKWNTNPLQRQMGVKTNLTSFLSGHCRGYHICLIIMPYNARQIPGTYQINVNWIVFRNILLTLYMGYYKKISQQPALTSN